MLKAIFCFLHYQGSWQVLAPPPSSQKYFWVICQRKLAEDKGNFQWKSFKANSKNETLFHSNNFLFFSFLLGDVTPAVMNPLLQPCSVPLAEGIYWTISDMNADHVMVTQETLSEQLVKNYPGNFFISPFFKKWLYHQAWVSDFGQGIRECLQAKLERLRSTVNRHECAYFSSICEYCYIDLNAIFPQILINLWE